MNDRMRKGCCRLLALLLTLVLVIPAYGQETLDALAAAQGCTAETLLQSDKLTAGDSVSDWVAIAVSRAGTEGDTSAYRKALERYVTRMYREQGGLDRLRATEWQRTALTALALGADPTAFGRDKNGRSVNLLADGVYQFTAAKSLGTQGLNGWIFGLIALDSARFAVPEDAVYTRATILQALVAAQEPEGGFGLTVGNSDVDLTAMTLQALAPYQNSTVTYTGAAGESVTIREVVRRALAWLSDQQTAEGDFISWDAANLESTAQVIIHTHIGGFDGGAALRCGRLTATESCRHVVSKAACRRGDQQQEKHQKAAAAQQQPQFPFPHYRPPEKSVAS